MQNYFIENIFLFCSKIMRYIGDYQGGECAIKDLGNEAENEANDYFTELDLCFEGSRHRHVCQCY